MKNCKFTRLKSSVDNENLQIFGKGFATVVVSNNSDIRVGIVCGNVNGGGTIELIEGTAANVTIKRNDSNMSKEGNIITVSNNGQDAYVSTSNDNYIIFNGAGTYKFKYDKYNVYLYSVGNGSNQLPKIGLDLEELVYLQSPSYIKDAGYWNPLYFKGDVSVFADKLQSSSTAFSISHITDQSSPLYSFNIEGNIESLAQCANLTEISFSVCNKLGGNLSTLLSTHPNKSNITKININNCARIDGGSLATMLGSLTSLTTFNGENNTHFSGSITDLAQAQVSNGRTSGTLTIGGYMPNVTPSSASSGRTIRFGTSMVNPTAEETTQGYQIA